MARTILITGSASGIGQATADLLKARGDRVIGVDIHDADIIADLTTAQGRTAMVESAVGLAPDGLDGVMAGAGISAPDRPLETVALNFFGAVATLEGLRPLLAKARHPRAVAICSTAALLPHDGSIAQACLAGDEPRALEAARVRPFETYMASKYALSRWLRQTAITPEWAGSGILLNGVAPGVVLTPMTAPLLDDPTMVEMIGKSNPMAVEGFARPEEIAELNAYLLGFAGHYLVGQIIFNDGGTDAIMRPDIF